MRGLVILTSSRYGYILTIEERFWNRFCRLHKAGKATHAYVLGGPALSDDVKLVFFYSVLPFKEILGSAKCLGKTTGDSSKLWSSLGHETCFNSYDEYVKLTRGKEKVTFIRFNRLREAHNAVAFSQVSSLLETERMSQTGMYVNKAQAHRLIGMLYQTQ